MLVPFTVLNRVSVVLNNVDIKIMKSIYYLIFCGLD